MTVQVACWWFKEDFIYNGEADEIEYMGTFDMLDPYLFETYRFFEIIQITLQDSPNQGYIIDNTQYLRSPCKNV